MPHTVFDVVAEDPEVQHVPAEMHPSAVQEHRRQQRRPVGCGDQWRQILPRRVLTRDDAPGLDERLDRLLTVG